jgi:hypothetical protein
MRSLYDLAITLYGIMAYMYVTLEDRHFNNTYVWPVPAVGPGTHMGVCTWTSIFFCFTVVTGKILLEPYVDFFFFSCCC